MPALYMSPTHSTAIAEYMQSLVRLGTLVGYQVRATAILDVTNLNVRARLMVDESLLTLDWRHARDIGRGTPRSWEFTGQAVAAGLDGMRMRRVGILVTTSCCGGGARVVSLRREPPC